jgi:hypothetical protein
VYGPADGLHGLTEVGPCDIFCFFSIFFSFFDLVLLDIFLYFSIFAYN